MKNVAEIRHHFPINPQAEFGAGYSCECKPNETIPYNSSTQWELVKFTECQSPVSMIKIGKLEKTWDWLIFIAMNFVSQAYNGTLVGDGCKYYPDVFLMSVLLFIGTFLISVTLKDFRNSSFFPSKVRISYEFRLLE